MEVKKRRVVYNMILVVILVSSSVCLLGVERVFASFEQVERSEDELLIFETHVNDKIRSLGMLAFLPQGDTVMQSLLPISSVARALSFSIKADPARGVVQGWFFQEHNIFQMDLNQNTVLVGGSEMPIPKGGVEAHYDDVYVQASLLQEWFGVAFHPDISTLRLYLKSEKTLPFEEEEERKLRAANLPQLQSKSNNDYAADMLLPYQWWTNPSVVWQQNVNGSSNKDNRNLNTSFSLQSSSDAMKFGSKFLFSGSVDGDNGFKIDNSKLTFERRDPGNSMLGMLKAGKVAVGDVTYPDVPLSIGQKRGRGISVSSDSNFNIARSYGAEKFDIEGDAPIGWDAELYRNGYFVAFQEVGSDGRYNFEETALIRGYNLIQVTLYGPEGQKRTETHRIIRGQDMLHEGELDYEFAAGQPEADFIPLAKNARTSSAFGGSGHVAYGFKKYLTIGGSVYSGEDVSSVLATRQTSGSVSAVTAIGGVKMQAQAMRANEGRSGYSFDTTTRFLGMNISAEHTIYNGFDADDKDVIKTTSLDINRNLGRVSTNFHAEKTSYQRKDDEVTLEGSISTRISRLQLNNRLLRTFSDNQAQEAFRGELSALTNISSWRLRANLGYDIKSGVQDKLQDFNFSAYRDFGRDTTIRLNGTYNFTTDISSTDMRYTREFDRYALDFNLGGTTQNAYFGGITFRTAFQPDHTGKYRMVSARDGGLGSVGLRAFVDGDANGVYDEGERLLSGISFRSNRGELDDKTGEDGTVFINGLSEGSTVFSLDKTNLPSIYLKPVNESLEIIPRSGATTTIDVAFEQLGEVDGFVTFERGDGKAATGVELVLYRDDTGEEVANTVSEYDGYYIFSALPLGRYRVEAMPLWEGDGGDTPVFINIEMTGENPILTDRNIEVPAPMQMALSLEMIEASSGVEAEEGQTSLPKVTLKPKEQAEVLEDGVFIHLGSLSTLRAAEEEQAHLWTKFADMIGDLMPHIYEVSIDGHMYYRVMGEVRSKSRAAHLCKELLEGDISGGCVVLKM